MENVFKFKDLGTYVLQGLCFYNDYMLVTAYDFNRNLNSKLFAIKDNNILFSTMLPTKAHVGGIDYDGEFVWITDKCGYVSKYKLSIENKDLSFIDKFSSDESLINIYGNKAASYLCYYNNNIYVGNYALRNSYLIKYNMNFKSVDKYKVINKVQGVCFYKDYIIYSTSRGYFSSYIYFYKNDKFIKKIRLHRMLEQICVKDDYLYCIFESNSKKYKLPFDNIYDIKRLKLDI